MQIVPTYFTISFSVSQCQQYKEMASVPENKPSGTFVLQVHAVDADEGANGKVTYGFMHKDSTVPAFNIDPDTGASKIKLDQMIFGQMSIFITILW